MSDDIVNQFIQGEDGLARLLREALPCFEAPAAMEARFQASMAEMQASRIAAESLVFEAPSSQATAFARLMADIQTAQEPRRDAVIKKIQAGESAQVVLGAELGAEAHAWLAQQSLSKKAPAPAEEPHAWHVPTWLWGGFGFAMVSVFAVSLVMKMGVFSFGHQQEMVAKPATVQLAVLEQKVMSAPAAVAPAPVEETARTEPAAKENYAPAVDAAPKPQLQARAEQKMDQAAKIAATSEAKKEREADLSDKKVIGELAMNEIQPAAVAAALPPPMAAAPAAPAPVAVMSVPLPVAGLMADQASAERAKGVVAASKRARLAKSISPQSFSLQQSPVEAAKQALAGKDGANTLIVKMANPATPEAAAWFVGFQNAVKAESHDGVRSVQVETDANLPAEQVSVVVSPAE